MVREWDCACCQGLSFGVASWAASAHGTTCVCVGGDTGRVCVKGRVRLCVRVRVP